MPTRPAVPGSSFSAQRISSPVVLMSTKSPLKRQPVARNPTGITLTARNRFVRLPAKVGPGTTVGEFSADHRAIAAREPAFAMRENLISVPGLSRVCYAHRRAPRTTGE